MPVNSIKIQSKSRKVGLLVALILLIIANYFFGKWALADMASTHADAIEVADLAQRLGPDDPQTHYAAAVLYENSFQPEDIGRSLNEYAAATALSPNNYLFWLSLGNARARDGDLLGAERSLRAAVELAPNYAAVRWPLGNVLLRQGKTEEAFSEIRKAAAANSTYASAAADIAWQYYDGDIERIRQAIGDSPRIIGALIPRLAAQKRIDEALALWDTLPREQKPGSLKQAGTALYGELIAIKRFRDAVRVYSDISSAPAVDIQVRKITNGDFEGDIKMLGASAFEWTIADGTQPQIALTDGQRHGGGRSLLVIFNPNNSGDFRTISQTVAVEPGKTYIFDAYYKAELKTSASLRWEIVEASDGKVLAETGPIVSVEDWAVLKASFSVPETHDGVTIRLARSGCNPQVCPISGKIWFDDFILNGK